LEEIYSVHEESKKMIAKYKAWGWLSLSLLILVIVYLVIFAITYDWFQSLIITVFGFPVHLIFLVFGCGCIVKGFFQICERPILKVAIEGKQPKNGHRVAIFGTIEPISEPIHTPFSQKECVGYKYFIKHEKSDIEDVGVETTYFIIAAGWALAPAKIVSIEGVFRMGGFPLIEDYPEEEKIYNDEDRPSLDATISTINFEMAGYQKWFVRNIESVTPDSILFGESLYNQKEDNNKEIRRDIKFFKNLYPDFSRRRPDYTVETLIPIGADACVIGTYVAEKNILVSGRWRSMRIINGDRSKVMESMRMNYWAWFVVGLIPISIWIGAVVFLTN
jgi:hypothetical protein